MNFSLWNHRERSTTNDSTNTNNNTTNNNNNNMEEERGNNSTEDAVVQTPEPRKKVTDGAAATAAAAAPGTKNSQQQQQTPSSAAEAATPVADNLPEDDDIRDDSQHDVDILSTTSSSAVAAVASNNTNTIMAATATTTESNMQSSSPSASASASPPLRRKSSSSAPFFDAIVAMEDVNDDDDNDNNDKVGQSPPQEEPPQLPELVSTTTTTTTTTSESAKPKKQKSSASQLRKQRIINEVQVLLETTIRNELEEGDDDATIDPELTHALLQAAHKLCYRKQYYDVTRDVVVTYPSVAKTVVNGTLLDVAAAEFCTSQDYREDGLPILYTAALRATASDLLLQEEEGEGVDDDAMKDTSLRDRLATTVHSQSVSSSQQSVLSLSSQQSIAATQTGDDVASVVNTTTSASANESQRSRSSFAESSVVSAFKSDHNSETSVALEPVGAKSLLLGPVEASETENADDEELLFTHRSVEVGGDTKASHPKKSPSEVHEQTRGTPVNANTATEINDDVDDDVDDDELPDEFLEITVHSATGREISAHQSSTEPSEFEEETYHSNAGGVYIYAAPKVDDEFADEDITFHSSSAVGEVVVTTTRGVVFDEIPTENSLVVEENDSNILPPAADAEDAQRVQGKDETISLAQDSQSLPLVDPKAFEGLNAIEEDDASYQAAAPTENEDEEDEIIQAARAAAEEAKLIQREQSRQQKAGRFMGGIFKGLLGSNSNVPSIDKPASAEMENAAEIKTPRKTSLEDEHLSPDSNGIDESPELYSSVKHTKDIPDIFIEGTAEDKSSSESVKSRGATTDPPLDAFLVSPKNSPPPSEVVTKDNPSVNDPIHGSTVASNSIHLISTPPKAVSNVANLPTHVGDVTEETLPVNDPIAVSAAASNSRHLTTSPPKAEPDGIISPRQVRDPTKDSYPVNDPIALSSAVSNGSQQLTACPFKAEPDGAVSSSSLAALQSVLMPSHSASEQNPARSGSAAVPKGKQTSSADFRELSDDQVELARLEALLQTPLSPIRPTKETPKPASVKSPEMQKLEELLLGDSIGNAQPLPSNENVSVLRSTVSAGNTGAASFDRTLSSGSSSSQKKTDALSNTTSNELKERMRRIERDIAEIEGNRNSRPVRAVPPIPAEDQSQDHRTTDPDQAVPRASNETAKTNGAVNTSDDEIAEVYDTLLANATKQLEDLRSEMDELKEMSRSMESEDSVEDHTAAPAETVKPTRLLEPPTGDASDVEEKKSKISNETVKPTRLLEPPSGDASDIEEKKAKISKDAKAKKGRKKVIRKKKKRKEEKQREKIERRSNRSITNSDHSSKSPLEPDEGGNAFRIEDPEGDLDMTEHADPRNSERCSSPAGNGAEDADGDPGFGLWEKLDNADGDVVDPPGKNKKNSSKTVPEIEEDVDFVDYEVALQDEDDKRNNQRRSGAATDTSWEGSEERLSRGSLEDDYNSRDPSAGYDYASRDPSTGYDYASRDPSVESNPMDRGYSSTGTGEEDVMYRSSARQSGQYSSKRNHQQKQEDDWEDVPCSFCCRYLPHNWVVATSYAYGLNGDSSKEDKNAKNDGTDENGR